MISWKPVLPEKLNIETPSAKKEYGKIIISLIFLLITGIVLIIFLPNYLFVIPILAVFIFIYVKNRKFLLSYWYTYEENARKYYYEDYSLKDSLMILLLFIGGIILIVLLLFIIIKFRLDLSSLRWIYNLEQYL